MREKGFIFLYIQLHMKILRASRIKVIFKTSNIKISNITKRQFHRTTHITHYLTELETFSNRQDNEYSMGLNSL